MDDSGQRVGLSTPEARFLEILRSLDGERESSPNRSELIDRIKTDLHGTPDSAPYCVDLIRWVAHQVDMEMGTKNILFPTRSARQLMEKTIKLARLPNPKPGCVVVWGMYDVKGQPTPFGHVGAVIALQAGGRMDTVEGNTSPKKNVDREGDGIHLKDRHQFVRTGLMRTLGFLRIWMP
jgi:hypothetical protein